MQAGPRLLTLLGITFTLLGLMWALLPHLRLGRLPGDLSFGGERRRVYIPIVTSLLLSVVLTLLFNLVGRLLGPRR